MARINTCTRQPVSRIRRSVQSLWDFILTTPVVEPLLATIHVNGMTLPSKLLRLMPWVSVDNLKAFISFSNGLLVSKFKELVFRALPAWNFKAMMNV